MIEVVKGTNLLLGLAPATDYGRKVLSLRLRSPQISCDMTHITAAQRYTIFSMLQAGFTQTKIAQTIGKHKSTISREIARNSDRRSGKYKCEQAQRKAEQRQHDKPHCRRLDDNAKSLINSLLCEEEWSPFQTIPLLGAWGK